MWSPVHTSTGHLKSGSTLIKEYIDWNLTSNHWAISFSKMAYWRTVVFNHPPQKINLKENTLGLYQLEFFQKAYFLHTNSRSLPPDFSTSKRCTRAPKTNSFLSVSAKRKGSSPSIFSGAKCFFSRVFFNISHLGKLGKSSSSKVPEKHGIS